MRFRLSMHSKWTGLLASTPVFGTLMTLTLGGYLVWQLDLDSSKREVISIGRGCGNNCKKKTSRCVAFLKSNSMTSLSMQSERVGGKNKIKNKYQFFLSHQEQFHLIEGLVDDRIYCEWPYVHRNLRCPTLSSQFTQIHIL